MPELININRVLYTFHWLALRSKLQFHDSLLAAASIRDLERYVNTGPAHDPEVNRMFRVLDVIGEAIEGIEGNRKKRSPEHRHILSLLDSYHRQLSARWEQIKTFPPIVMTEVELKRELQEAFTGGQKAAFAGVKAFLADRFTHETAADAKADIHRYLCWMDSVDGTARETSKGGACLSKEQPVECQ